jgi:hypothetical protein
VFFQLFHLLKEINFCEQFKGIAKSLEHTIESLVCSLKPDSGYILFPVPFLLLFPAGWKGE